MKKNELQMKEKSMKLKNIYLVSKKYMEDIKNLTANPTTSGGRSVYRVSGREKATRIGLNKRKTSRRLLFV